MVFDSHCFKIILRSSRSFNFFFFSFRILVRGKFWWFRVNAFQLATVSNKRKRVRRPLQRRLSKQCLYLHEWTLKDSLRLYDTRDQHADPPHVTCSFDSTRVQTPASRYVCTHTRISRLWYADAPFPGAASASLCRARFFRDLGRNLFFLSPIISPLLNLSKFRFLPSKRIDRLDGLDRYFSSSFK